mmetsp:Transcript_1138/g.4385  ORF Transcript_1138/g.4385 Transcript_1138/m.4385 type:complete len:267 (-) Transcript_1138:1550-2350(-)
MKTRAHDSHEPEPFALENGRPKLRHQLVLGLVLGQQHMAEAGVCRGQELRVGACPRDGQAHRPEPSDGCSCRPSREGEELPLFLGRQLVLDRLPEPLDHLVVCVVRLLVARRGLELGEVEVLGACDQQLHLFGLEHLGHLSRDHVCKALAERLELLTDELLQGPGHVALHVLGLVGLGHGALCAVGNKLVRLGRAPRVVGRREVERHHVLDVVGLVVQQSGERFRDAGPKLGQVAQRHGLAKQAPVHNRGELHVQDDGVVDGHAQQ